MADLRCPHDPIIGECPDCAAIKRKADQAAALEVRMEAIARKAVVEHMGDCPSCAAKDARIKRLEDAIRWAIDNGTDCGADSKFGPELRRRAEMEEGEKG